MFRVIRTAKRISQFSSSLPRNTHIRPLSTSTPTSIHYKKLAGAFALGSLGTGLIMTKLKKEEPLKPTVEQFTAHKDNLKIQKLIKHLSKCDENDETFTVLRAVDNNISIHNFIELTAVFQAVIDARSRDKHDKEMPSLYYFFKNAIQSRITTSAQLISILNMKGISREEKIHITKLAQPNIPTMMTSYLDYQNFADHIGDAALMPYVTKENANQFLLDSGTENCGFNRIKEIYLREPAEPAAAKNILNLLDDSNLRKLFDKPENLEGLLDNVKIVRTEHYSSRSSLIGRRTVYDEINYFGFNRDERAKILNRLGCEHLIKIDAKKYCTETKDKTNSPRV